MYLQAREPLQYLGHQLGADGARETIVLTVCHGGQIRVLHGSGNGPLDALLNALQPAARLHAYEERSMGQGGDATAIAFAEIAAEGLVGTTFGAGQHANIVTASILGVISGLNRIVAKLDPEARCRFFGHPELQGVGGAAASACA